MGKTVESNRMALEEEMARGKGWECNGALKTKKLLTH
jgi:hypothetical protein